MLEVEVRHGFGDFELSAKFEAPADVTALIGISGAGKSSLLRLIAGLEKPASGYVRNDGIGWSDTDKSLFVPSHKRRIGMVFQRPRLLAHLSVAQNIMLGARGAEIDRALMDRTGCAQLLERPVRSLSGGEMQRVMLARALVGQPTLLLLDEPLSALDEEARGEMLALLRAILPQLEVPVIYVTHALDETAQLATRLARLEQGKLVASGSPAEVLPGLDVADDAGGEDAQKSAAKKARARRTMFGVSAHEAGTSSVLKGVVAGLEAGGLARVDVDGQQVEIPAAGVKNGEAVALRLWARDLILAQHKPKAISARNCLVGRIENLTPLPSGQVLVRVMIEGAPVDVLVMARTAHDMKLAAEQAIFVVFKSASLEMAEPKV